MRGIVSYLIALVVSGFATLLLLTAPSPYGALGMGIATFIVFYLGRYSKR
jgi:hypothetical protein